MKVKTLNSYGAEWDFGKAQRMDRYIKEHLKDGEGVDYSKVIEACGPLLKYPKVGGLLYELVLDIFSEKKDTARIKTTLKELTSRTLIYDFVLEMRNILSGTDLFGADILSVLMKICNIVLQAYNLGRLEGVISAKELVVVSDAIDPSELSLIFYLELNDRPQLKQRITNFESTYDTDVKRYRKYLRTRDHFDLVSQAEQLLDKDLVIVANNASSTMYYSYTNNLFNEVDDHFYPEYDLLQTAHWEREETVNPSSSVIMFFMVMLNNFFDKELLQTRKFYVREKGVKIVFDPAVNTISSIEVREVHNDNEYDEHYLNFFYTLDSGETRMFYLSMKDLSNAEMPLLYEKDAEVTMMILAWLGILDEFSINPQKMFEIIRKEEPKVTMSSCIVLAKGMNRWLKYCTEAMTSKNYYYETPTQWNYSVEVGSKTRSLGSGTSQRLVTVGRYTRKLPDGQKPSSDALALAKKFYIELKDGYTIVDEFERLHRIRS